MDELYSERAQCVAAFLRAARAFGHEAWWATDPEAPGFPLVFVELGEGQVSWHFAQSDFDTLIAPLYLEKRDVSGWDGHDSTTKYQRLNAWLRRT